MEILRDLSKIKGTNVFQETCTTKTNRCNGYKMKRQSTQETSRYKRYHILSLQEGFEHVNSVQNLRFRTVYTDPVFTHKL